MKVLTLIIIICAVLPRIRYDQLIIICRLQLLPLIFTIAVLVSSLTLIPYNKQIYVTISNHRSSGCITVLRD
jgi:NADH:ubiquinone oxidoreductase subunit H